MTLPFGPPLSPMLATLSHSLPEGEGMIYEPKWDGFRCIVFRDGDLLELASRREQPLTRYFPELTGPLRAMLPPACVLDGEIVIAGPAGLDFDALLQRIHPAASRVQVLAAATPASLVAFDLLALGADDLRRRPFRERRAQLEDLLATARAPLHLTPATTDPLVAADWFERFEGAGLDGVVAKRPDLQYAEAKRVMVKVKHERTAECVVAGFRYRSGEEAVGSLLLGLYDDEEVLQHVGVTSSFTVARRRELLAELAAYRLGPDDDHPWLDALEISGGSGLYDEPASGMPARPAGRRPGTPSRWSAKQDLSFEPLEPRLVCEVAYDHLQGTRFRHATTFRRWRPDREPASCTYRQLDVAVPAELREVLSRVPRLVG
ncbi:MAG TPA: ATP-dependent DNA ligase [Acidimicrobiales bacterium]|nr:ATP-dependent DNA ligase [Acidimicrobiales bacterium]